MSWKTPIWHFELDNLLGFCMGSMIDWKKDQEAVCGQIAGNGAIDNALGLWLQVLEPDESVIRQVVRDGSQSNSGFRSG